MDLKNFLTPDKNPDLIQAHEFQRQHLPTLWLLGKTGAGKSSLIQSITQLSSVEIGNGFQPCTLTSMAYEFPQDKPIMRFLDTRGLGEANYDASTDIAEALKASHGLVVVMKLDDPEQSTILDALKIIKKSKIKHLLLVHTGALEFSEHDKNRLMHYQRQQVQQIWGKQFNQIAVDFEGEENTIYQEDELINALATLLPVIGLLSEHKAHSNIENMNFKRLEKEVLWYAGSAAASDLIPVVGLVSVPLVQAKMLHSLASQYDIVWNKRTMAEFMSTLGGSFALQYSVRLGARQFAKLIPVYGQTIGSATAAAMSFGSTYGLGRAACYYFYHKNKGGSATPEDLQALYKTALNRGKKASGYEKN